MLASIEAQLDRRDWRRIAGKSDREVFVSLVRLAREHGRLIPTGVRVSIDIRSLALASAVSKPTVIKAVRRLRRLAWFVKTTLSEAAQKRARSS